MVTRLYLANAAPPLTPSNLRGSWDQTSGAINSKLSVTKSGTNTSVAIAETNATNNWDVLLARFISDPIAATSFTAAHTVSWIAAVLESANNANDFFHVHIYVTAGDTDTVRGTLLTDNIGATEWTTTTTGRGEGAKTLSAVSALTGDRIVVEIGYQGQNTSGTSMTGTVRYGGTDATDLTQGNTANVTTRSGYVEFSVDFVTITRVDVPTATASASSTVPIVDIPTINRMSYARGGSPFRALANRIGSWGFDYVRSGLPGPLVKLSGDPLSATVAGEVASATSAASAPTPILTLIPGASTATASAAVPAVVTAPVVVVPLSTATSAASAPAILISSTIVIPAATATGTSPDASVSISSSGSPAPWAFDYARRGAPLRGIGTPSSTRAFDYARRNAPIRSLTGVQGPATVTITAPLSTASAAAYAASTITYPTLATATAAALTPSLVASIPVTPDAATATATALAPIVGAVFGGTVSVPLSTAIMRMVGTYSGSEYGDGEVDGYPQWAEAIPIPLATASAAAHDVPGFTVTVQATTASATATALAPDLSKLVGVPAATASAATLQPGFGQAIAVPASTASAVSPAAIPNPTVAVPVATATAAMPSPSFIGVTSATLFPPVSTATADALAPSVTLGYTAIVPAATADAAAAEPTVVNDYVLVVPAATATATALVPRVVVLLPLTTMMATGAALTPIIGLGYTIVVPASTATGTALAPTLVLSIVVPKASATGTAPNPALTGDVVEGDLEIVLAVTATGTAAALAPDVVVDDSIAVPESTATGAAFDPIVTVDLTLVVPTATAIAEAIVPEAFIDARTMEATLIIERAMTARLVVVRIVTATLGIESAVMARLHLEQ